MSKNSHMRAFSMLTLALVVLLVFNQSAQAQLQFSNPTNYLVGSSPVVAAVGDFNGDGKQDLVVANSGGASVSVLLGTGSGSFQPAINYAAGDSPTFIAVDDFNGDGKLDLAVANGSANLVSVLQGNGDGTFQLPISYSIVSLASFVAVGDFNGDAIPDLLILGVADSPAPAVLTVLIGKGDGTFRTGLTSSVAASTCPRWCPTGSDWFGPVAALGDFNGDGHLDVAIAEDDRSIDFGRGNLIILLGKGDGSFQVPNSFPMAPLANAGVISGDFNADGKIDLALPGAFGIYVLLGNGDGTFRASPENPIKLLRPFLIMPPYAAAIDLNGDGNLDLVSLVNDFAITDRFGNSPFALRWALGRGDGTFQGPAEEINPCVQSSDCILLSLVPASLAIGKFHVGGLPDLVVVNHNVPYDPRPADSVSVFSNRTGQDFSLSAAASTLLLKPGDKNSDVITVAGRDGSFEDAIHLKCEATGITCVLFPASVIPGSNSATATLTVSMPVAAAMRSGLTVKTSLYALLIPLLLGIPVRRKTRRVRLSSLFIGVLGILLIIQIACGAGDSTMPSPRNYTVIVTGTFGATQHTTEIAVTVP